MLDNTFSVFLQHIITFFAIIDPIGVSAIMLSILGKNVNKNTILIIAKRVSVTLLIAFVVVLVTGNFILNLFGIDTNSLKVIGGIVLILTSLQMIQSQSTNDNLENLEEKDALNLAIIPISIPITFGPGIFSAIIIVRDQAQNYYEIFAIILAFLINIFVVYFIFKNSIYLKSYLGDTGQNIITKLMGLIVGAIAVQFIISGTIKLIEKYS